MKNDRLGLALIVSAPSGAGKSTLVKRLLGEFPRLGFSVSCTTREPRPGEEDGRDYIFLAPDRFTALIGEGHFAEWAMVHGNYYGTPKQAVLDQLGGGRDIIFDIDVQGAKALSENLGLGRTVFILPPSFEALKARLTGRGSDSPETIARRLSNAKEEIAQADRFDHVIINDDVDVAADELRAVYLALRATPGLRPNLVERVLSTWPREG